MKTIPGGAKGLEIIPFQSNSLLERKARGKFVMSKECGFRVCLLN